MVGYDGLLDSARGGEVTLTSQHVWLSHRNYPQKMSAATPLLLTGESASLGRRHPSGRLDLKTLLV